MSDMAKQARAAMKAKAKSLTTTDPHQKVDSSTWTPPEPLNTEVKTGLRPISRRAFKKGGKVMGQKPKANLGKATRGGNKPLTPDNFANKDVKAANEDRAGLKHVGALKTGGRAKKNAGGPMPLPVPRPKNLDAEIEAREAANQAKQADAMTSPEWRKELEARQNQMTPRKSGGKIKKAVGGPLANAQAMMKRAQETGGVPASTLNSAPTSSRFSKAAGLKKGGTAKHDDAKQDMALIKKMVKSSARTGRKEGGGVFSGPGYPGKIPGVVPGGREARATGGKTKGKTNINIVIAAGKPAGQDEMGPNPMGGPTRPPGGMPVAVPPPQGGAPAGGMPMAMPIPMPMPGGMPPGVPPTPRKSGGRIKKYIGGGSGSSSQDYPGNFAYPAEDEPQEKPQYRKPTDAEVKAIMDQSVGNISRAMQNQPGIVRKAGGRISKVASSYKDMEAGSAGGEGRLQKTDIAKKHKGAPAFKKGGKVYRSYKDMDAGSASGMGRLEKTEIQARKR